MKNGKKVIFILITLIIFTICVGGMVLVKRTQSINNSSSNEKIIYIDDDEKDEVVDKSTTKKEDTKEEKSNEVDNNKKDEGIKSTETEKNNNNNNNVKKESTTTVNNNNSNKKENSKKDNTNTSVKQDSTKQEDGVDNVTNESGSTKNNKKKKAVNTTKENDSTIEKIIKDNDLEKYRDLIYENKDLFTKYYKVVEANNNLGEGKRNVYNLFIVIVDNKEYLNEEIFFRKLGNLKIKYANKVPGKGSISGEYYYNSNEICIYDNKDNVLYHELMHFVDYNLNSNIADTVYSYDNKVISSDEYNKLSSKEKNNAKIISNFIDYDEVTNNYSEIHAEGGAELYSSRYFSYSYTRSYKKTVYLYYIFEYLYSEESMKAVFFGHESLYGLTGGYFNEYQYKEFLNTIYAITNVYATSTAADYRHIFDSMIGLYTYSRGEDWYNDKEFCLLLYNFIEYDAKMIEGSSNYDICKDYLTYYNNLYYGFADNFDVYTGTESYIRPQLVYENKKIYFVTFINLETEDETFIKYLYDIDNGSFKETYRIKYSRR